MTTKGIILSAEAATLPRGKATQVEPEIIRSAP
jgi:hypothetical protein